VRLPKSLFTKKLTADLTVVLSLVLAIVCCAELHVADNVAVKESPHVRSKISRPEIFQPCSGYLFDATRLAMKVVPEY